MPPPRRNKRQHHLKEHLITEGTLVFAMPTDDEIERFKNLYKEKFSLELTRDEAREAATFYLHVFQLLTYEH